VTVAPCHPLADALSGDVRTAAGPRRVGPSRFAKVRTRNPSSRSICPSVLAAARARMRVKESTFALSRSGRRPTRRRSPVRPGPSDHRGGFSAGALDLGPTAAGVAANSSSVVALAAVAAAATAPCVCDPASGSPAARRAATAIDKARQAHLSSPGLCARSGQRRYLCARSLCLDCAYRSRRASCQVSRGRPLAGCRRRRRVRSPRTPTTIRSR